MVDWKLPGVPMRHAALMCALLLAGCDDAVPGPIGGLILVIEPTPWDDGRGGPHAAVEDIERIELNTVEIEAIVDGEHITLDTATREVVIDAGGRETLVAQYQVPVGMLEQIRVFVDHVDVVLNDSTSEQLDRNSQLPSWKQSGWKLTLEDPIEIIEDELSGMRVDFDFDVEVLHNNGQGFKLQPTTPAYSLDVNPLPGQAGIFADQITVWFDEITTPQEVDQINDPVGVRVLVPPLNSQVWRLKLPPTMNLEQAADYYRAQPEVNRVLPSINYAYNALPSEASGAGITRELESINADNLWDERGRFSDVASRDVVVAIVDCGIDLRSSEFLGSIHINSDEIPPATLAAVDLDQNGRVTWQELNQPGNFDPGVPCRESDQMSNQPKAAFGVFDRPNRFNQCNGVIDAMDLAGGEGEDWYDKEDTDGNGFSDDLFGYDAADQGPPQTDTDVCQHGTAVAGIVAARPDNGIGVAGVAHGVTLLPIKISDAEGAASDVFEAEAYRYIDEVKPDIVVMSYSQTIASANADLRCAHGSDDGFSKGVEAARYDVEVAIDLATFADQGSATPDQNLNLIRERLGADGRTLYVVAAGNERLFLPKLEFEGNAPTSGVYQAPGLLLQHLLPDQTLLVGATNRRATDRITSSNSGDAVDIWAPGRWTNYLGDDDLFSGHTDGTSFAAPVIAGHAAIVLTDQPQHLGSASNVRDAVLDASGVVHVDTSCPGRGEIYDADVPFVDMVGHL